MPLKAVPTANILATVTILRLSGTQDNTNIAKLSKQLVKWYKKIITQLTDN